MNIKGKLLLREYGVAVPRGEVATSPQEARRVAESLGGQRWVVKAQIHAGGRGRGGGIKLVSSLQDVEKITAEILSHRLVTPQTGPAGRQVRQVLIEEACDIAQELYCSILVDRAVGQTMVMMSPAGGMAIEEIAATTPEKIFSPGMLILLIGLAAFQARALVEELGVSAEGQTALAGLLQKLYTIFRDKDCSLLEMNPLVLTTAGTPVGA